MLLKIDLPYIMIEDIVDSMIIELINETLFKDN